MKTQIIQLNKSDDIISVQEKMDWSQTGQILLIVPSGGQSLSRKLDLNLIKRHASKMGAQVELLTKNPETRFFARQLGIPVFSDLRRAEYSAWSEGQRRVIKTHRMKSLADIQEMRKSMQPERQKWMEHPVTRIISFTMGVLALLAMVMVILPGATITLSPQVETQSLALSVIADPTASTANRSTGTLPSETREVIVEGERKMSVSGETLIPDQAANGVLRFTNITDHRISILPETVAATAGSEPVRFITPEYQELSIEPGKSILVNASAIIPGTAGNLPPGSITAIEGDLGLDATVTNIYASHGGTDAVVPSPTAEDLRDLTDNLVEMLGQVARDEFESNLFGGDMLILPSIRRVEIIDQTITPAVGEPGRELTLTLQLRFQVQVVKGEVMNDMAEPILDGSIKPGYQPLDGTIELSNLSVPVIGEDGKARWDIQAERKIQAIISSDKVVSMVKGLSVSKAKEQLEQSLPVAEQPQIRLSPTWWPRLPFVPMRIQISPAKS